MDIEAFYDADPRRRESAEVEYGRDWHDRAGNRYELSWVADTGELYVMGEPRGPGGLVDPFGDWFSAGLPAASVTVRVLTQVGDRDTLERALSGWQEAMGRADSTAWLVSRLRESGLAVEIAADPDAG